MKKLSSIALCLVLALGFATLVACEQEPEVENIDTAPTTMEQEMPADTTMEAEGEMMEEQGEEMEEMGDEMDDEMMEEEGEAMQEEGEAMQEGETPEPQQ